MLKKSILFVALLFGASLVSTAVAQNYADGVEYYKAGQPDRAKIILDNTLPGLSATDKAAALYYLGEAEFALGNKEVASKCFNEGVKQDAAYPYNYIGLGKLLLGVNDKEAEANFKKAVKLSIFAVIVVIGLLTQTLQEHTLRQECHNIKSMLMQQTAQILSMHLCMYYKEILH